MIALMKSVQIQYEMIITSNEKYGWWKSNPQAAARTIGINDPIKKSSKSCKSWFKGWLQDKAGWTITSLVWVRCKLKMFTLFTFFRRCDESHRRKAKGLLGKMTINLQFKKMANEKVILKLRHAPLESTTPIKKSSKSCKSWFKGLLQDKAGWTITSLVWVRCK